MINISKALNNDLLSIYIIKENPLPLPVPSPRYDVTYWAGHRDPFSFWCFWQ